MPQLCLLRIIYALRSGLALDICRLLFVCRAVVGVIVRQRPQISRPSQSMIYCGRNGAAVPTGVAHREHRTIEHCANIVQICMANRFRDDQKFQVRWLPPSTAPQPDTKHITSAQHHHAWTIMSTKHGMTCVRLVCIALAPKSTDTTHAHARLLRR